MTRHPSLRSDLAAFALGLTLALAVGGVLRVGRLMGVGMPAPVRTPAPVAPAGPPVYPQLPAGTVPGIRSWTFEELMPEAEPLPTPPGYGGYRTVGGFTAESRHPEYLTTPWTLPDAWDALWRERTPAIEPCTKRMSMGPHVGTWTVLLHPERKALAIPSVFIAPDEAARLGLNAEQQRRADAWGACVTFELSSALVAEGAPPQIQVQLPLPVSSEEHKRRHTVEIPAAWRTPRNDPDGDGRVWKP